MDRCCRKLNRTSIPNLIVYSSIPPSETECQQEKGAIRPRFRIFSVPSHHETQI